MTSLQTIATKLAANPVIDHSHDLLAIGAFCLAIFVSVLLVSFIATQR
jgi:hypothetical protein